MKAVIAVVMGAAALATAQTATTSEPAVADIRAAAATTKPEVTTSDVKGLAFDRFYQVWLENIVRDKLPKLSWSLRDTITNGLIGLQQCRLRCQHAVACFSGYPAVGFQ